MRAIPQTIEDLWFKEKTAADKPVDEKLNCYGFIFLIVNRKAQEVIKLHDSNIRD